MKIPTCEEMGKEIAEKALDEYLIDGKSIREWISILADGEYIKKEDALSELNKWEWQELYLPIHFKENIIDMLPTYSIPDTAKPEEGAELIDRRQIKWYGCDHEGHIKGINCETADCSKCFYATVEHDEVMSLPVYSSPNSAENKRKWTPANNPPKKSGRYLAYIVNEYDEELQYIMTADYIARPRPIEGLSPWTVDDECASDNVVAWMPLPEPYKAEKGGE